MPVEIRIASSEDSPVIVEFVNRLIRELGGADLPVAEALETCESLTADEQQGLVLIAEESGSAVGICTISFQAAIRTLGKYAIVQEMYVSPEFRDQSIGAEVMNCAALEAQARGCSMIELGTPPNGHRQENFYRKLGFSAVGLRLRKSLGGS